MNFYKYRSLTGDGRKYTEDILLKGLFYFSSIDKFNDPFEFEFRLDFTATYDQKTKWLEKSQPNLYEQLKNAPKSEMTGYFESIERDKDLWLKNIRDRIIEESAVFCLSSTWSDISLWTHYADSHKGICIEFKNLKKTEFGDAITKVVYDDDLPVINVFTGNMERLISASKHKTFDKEQEYRILGSKDTKIFIKPVSNLISKIYFGVRFDFNDPILDLIKQTLPNVTLVTLKKSKVEYEVEIQSECKAKDFNAE